MEAGSTFLDNFKPYTYCVLAKQDIRHCYFFTSHIKSGNAYLQSSLSKVHFELILVSLFWHYITKIFLVDFLHSRVVHMY